MNTIKLLGKYKQAGFVFGAVAIGYTIHLLIGGLKTIGTVDFSVVIGLIIAYASIQQTNLTERQSEFEERIEERVKELSASVSTLDTQVKILEINIKSLAKLNEISYRIKRLESEIKINYQEQDD